jgi:hypothetical protein
MYARLWWKELRTFWPIWPVLVVVAAGVQWLLLWDGEYSVRTGFLIALGLSWSMLHAFAVGAAAFASERETNTQLFLDILPVSRTMLWTSKVTFALATTLGLALVLAGLGVLGTTDRDPAHYSTALLARGFGVMLFEGVAWSLLWSVLLDSVLQAGALGLLTVGFLNVLLSHDIDLWDIAVLAPSAGTRAALAAGALAVSWVVFTRGPRPDRSRSAAPRASHVRDAAARGRTSLVAEMLGSPFGRLAWEAAREARPIWLLLAGGAIGLPVVTSFGDRVLDPGLWSLVAFLASLLGGVSVFGPANRSRSYRFLDHHGVRPSAVWLARVVTSGAVMTLLLILAVVSLLLMGSSVRWQWQFSYAPYSPLWNVLEVVVLIVEGFVIGLICGQVFVRNITAWVVACLTFALMVFPQVGLVVAMIVPPWSQLLFPALLLAISWAWSGDWMHDRRGAMRWVRLGAMLGSAGVLLAAVYIGYRLWSVPDIGSPFARDPHFARAPAPPSAIEQENALEYERIVAEAHSASRPRVLAPDPRVVDHIVAMGWERATQNPEAGAWLEALRDLIPRIRRAADRPVRFPQSDPLDFRASRPVHGLGSLVRLLGGDSAGRRARGDLAGAWDDIRSALKISAQASRSAGPMERRLALSMQSDALHWGLAWAGDPRQTPASLRAALADFRALPPLEPAEDGLRTDAAWADRLFRRVERDPAPLLELANATLKKAHGLRALLASLIVAPWERERARRVVNLLRAEQLRLARTEPWERPRAAGHRRFGLHDPLDQYRDSTPLVGMLWWLNSPILIEERDYANLLSRAFEQVVALRIWQLEHGGRYPETLDALVPDLLPALPPDPYSGRPFRYRPAHHQPVLPLGLDGLRGGLVGEPTLFELSRPGQWLLYSVGPDRVDDGGSFSSGDNRVIPRDVIFALPEVQGPDR